MASVLPCLGFLFLQTSCLGLFSLFLRKGEASLLTMSYGWALNTWTSCSPRPDKFSADPHVQVFCAFTGTAIGKPYCNVSLQFPDVTATSPVTVCSFHSSLDHCGVVWAVCGAWQWRGAGVAG